MVIDRRKALFIITAALGRIARGSWRGFPANAGNDSASLDLSRIGSHVYSEEGIPMFLGCENTAARQTRVEPSDLNRKISSAFDRYAQEWSRMHPHAAAGDAAKLLEFLAGRDFTSGGLETNL